MSTNTGVYMYYGNFQFKPQDGYPIPQVSLSKEFDRDQGGRIIGSKTIVSLEGVIYNSGTTFTAILPKETGLRDAFSKDRSFRFGCGASAPSYSGNAKVTRYTSEKTENRWVSTIAYSVELLIEDLPSTTCSATGIYNVSSCQDEWNMEILDEYNYVNNPAGAQILRRALSFPIGAIYPLYRISRTIGAVGKFIPTGSDGLGISAISGAKQWVRCRLDTAPETSISGILSGIVLYNFTRSVNVDDPGGSYRLTDNWIGIPTGFASGLYMESFNVESSLDNTYMRTVTINGTVKGLEPFNTGVIYTPSAIGGSGAAGSILPAASIARASAQQSKYESALSGYHNVIKPNIFSRVQCFVEKEHDPNSTSQQTGIFRRFFGRDENPINPLPISITEGSNPTEGSVSYSWVYNNRPLNLISGSILETLTVIDNFPSQVIAELFVLGRRIGPVLQNLGTYTTASRDVTFEVTMLRPTGLSNIRFPRTAYIQITGLVESFNPTYLLNANICKSFVKANSESWSITEAKFTKQKTWVWQHCIEPTVGNPSV